MKPEHGPRSNQDRQCPRCTMKHLGQAKALAKLARLLLAEARVLGFEALKGYPHHYWDALGHMAQAEDEILVIMPKEAEMIRKARKVWEADEHRCPDFRKLMYAVSAAAGLCGDSERTRALEAQQMRLDLEPREETK